MLTLKQLATLGLSATGIRMHLVSLFVRTYKFCSENGPHLQILRAEISGDRRCRYGQRQVSF
jgi:hypothetical protein